MVACLVADFALTGCQNAPTLEDAQAACEKKGGMLMVIYSQKVSLSGVEPEVASPGDCIMPKQFEKDSDKPAAPAQPAKPAPAS